MPSGDRQDHRQHVCQAVSTGLAVYPGGIENQIVGGTTQILSRLLVEKYSYNTTNITSTDFVTSPAASKQMEVTIMLRIDRPRPPKTFLLITPSADPPGLEDVEISSMVGPFDIGFEPEMMFDRLPGLAELGELRIR